MRKIHQNGNHSRRAGRPAAVILAAVLAAAVLTATAFAAYRLMISEQFGGYFDDLTERQAEVMEQIGTSEMPASTANETTLTPLAVIGDSIRCYARFRLEAPEGTEFPTTAEELKFLHISGPAPDDMYSVVDEAGKRLSVSSGEIEWIDTTPGDHVLEFIIRFDSGMEHPAHFNDGTSKVLTIKGIWLEGLDKEYTKVLDGPWSFDIGFLGAIGEKTLDVDGLPVRRVFNGVEYEDEGMSMTLRAMSISPLSLSYAYDFTCPDPDRTLPGPGTVCIVMKDGSVVEVLRGGGGFWTDSYLSECDIIQVPIDLEQVAYIQFGSQKIYVS